MFLTYLLVRNNIWLAWLGNDWEISGDYEQRFR